MHGRNKTIRTLTLGLILSLVPITHGAQVDIHYLGHASFILQFDNGVSVLTDFGTSNSWGLASPIYDLGDFVPTVITYSHQHQDHYDLSRRPEGFSYQLENMDSLDIDGLLIRPVRVCEYAVGTPSSTAFVFEYEDITICHLSDAQAEILNIASLETQQHLKDIFPEQFDMLLMTIEGVDQFIPQAEEFINLLKPRHIIPMHYWTVSYKRDFLDYLESKDGLSRKNYDIHIDGLPDFTLSSDLASATPVQIISLPPAPFTNVTPIEEIPDVKPDIIEPGIQNFPNPFNEGTVIDYEIPEAGFTSIQIYDLNGKPVKTLISGVHHSGEHHVVWNGTDYSGVSVPSGIYLCRLQTADLYRNIKLLISK
ncbi:MAG: MBL fold metallo-hydrolase [Candidatus Marinimicrobia bacterium]|nr:MBL fold metallo-hydrolase [Candidatus Neomarinimicrobiota bacterium]